MYQTQTLLEFFLELFIILSKLRNHLKKNNCTSKSSYFIKKTAKVQKSLINKDFTK